MEKNLTHKQKIVLEAIAELKRKLGQEPTFEQLRDYIGYAKISSVQRHTEALKTKGFLKNERGISLADDSSKVVQIPLIGNVACGAPLFATENIEAFIQYDSSSLKGKAEDYFFLRAIGDSMNDARIKGKSLDDGDYALVKRVTTAENNAIVVALIGDNATIKKVVYESDRIKLVPQSNNPNNKPIFLFDNFLIQGIVVDVLKPKLINNI